MKKKENKSAAVAKPSVSQPLESTPVLVDVGIALHPNIIYREHSEESIKSLSVDIAQHGLLQPLVVWQDKESAFLIAGKGRLDAIRLLSSSKMNAMFKEGVPAMQISGTIDDARAAMVRENVHREDMAPGDILPTLNQLLEGRQQKDVAKLIGKSASWVSGILSIAKELGDEANEAIKDGDISVSQAAKAAKEVKEGKTTKTEALAKARTKTKAMKDAGKEREDKRPSLKVLWNRYKGLPSKGLTTGARMRILLGIVEFSVKETEELPAELEASE